MNKVLGYALFAVAVLAVMYVAFRVNAVRNFVVGAPAA